MSTCYCYMLRCADGSFYTGWTTNPQRRLKQHNSGRGAKYTRARRPVEMVYLLPCENRSEAMKKERQIKALSHAQKAALAASQPFNP